MLRRSIIPLVDIPFSNEDFVRSRPSLSGAPNCKANSDGVLMESSRDRGLLSGSEISSRESRPQSIPPMFAFRPLRWSLRRGQPGRRVRVCCVLWRTSLTSTHFCQRPRSFARRRLGSRGTQAALKFSSSLVRHLSVWSLDHERRREGSPQQPE